LTGEPEGGPQLETGWEKREVGLTRVSVLGEGNWALEYEYGMNSKQLERRWPGRFMGIVR